MSGMNKKLPAIALLCAIVGFGFGAGQRWMATRADIIQQAQGEAFQVALINFEIDEKHKYAVALEQYKLEYLNEIKWTIMAHEQRADWYKSMAEAMAGVDL